jgi:DegV family protein with EDD domain
MVKIVTDSTSDIPDELACQLGISIVPIIVQVDGTPYQDGITLSRQQFYAGLSAYRELPKTAAPSTDEFIRVFRNAKLKGADEVVAITINRKFSALNGVVEIAAHEVLADGILVHVIDSETVTMGLGWLAITAAQMAHKGIPVVEIIRQVESLRAHVIIYALVDTLQYLRRSGRASALMAGLGDMLQVKILLGVQDGEIKQIDRIRTRTRGIARMIEMAHSHRRLQHLSVLYTSDGVEKDLDVLRSSLCDLVPIDQQFTRQVTPVIGTHVGPMALGLALVADV